MIKNDALPRFQKAGRATGLGWARRGWAGHGKARRGLARQGKVSCHPFLKTEGKAGVCVLWKVKAGMK